MQIFLIALYFTRKFERNAGCVRRVVCVSPGLVRRALFGIKDLARYININKGGCRF